MAQPRVRREIPPRSLGGDGAAELARTVSNYLRQGDLLLLGCGAASVLDALGGEAFSTALGIDLSDEAIARAKRLASDTVTFQVADIERFHCPRPYDVMLFSESLYYLPPSHQLPVLRRLSGSLKPGGVFIVTLADAARYRDIILRIRAGFRVREERRFSGSARYLLVFQPPCDASDETATVRQKETG